MKKIFFLFLILLIAAAQAFASPAQYLKQFTLENGLEVFLLEDSSDALVHIEYTVKAGFSDQNQNNAGFFKLYSRLIGASAKHQFSDVQCNSDSSRFFITTTASAAEAVLFDIAEQAFNPQFSDELLNDQLAKLKSETMTAAEDMGTFINAAIDSRVFYDSPWKHESGIYPPLFKKTTQKQARNTIKYISDRYYTPQNSALFVYGNINADAILLTIKNTFGRYYSNYKTPANTANTGLSPASKKFVLHDSQISPDLTQIVIQYSALSMEQCDLMAAILNNNASSFKNNTLQIENLNIPGDEYINVQAAHKKNNSRLIFQTLLQKPENKKNEISSAAQALGFINEVQNSAAELPVQEINFAKQVLAKNMQQICDNPSLLMNNLSAFWAINQFRTAENQNSDNLISSFLERTERIYQTEASVAQDLLTAEEPFIFVIINSKDYKKYKKEYSAAGFEEITPANASWYVLQMYKEIRDELKPDEETGFNITKFNSNDNNYFDKNYPLLKTAKLSNGINITTKTNFTSERLSLMLSINGGKLYSADNHGFEEAMINLLATMIQLEIARKQAQGIILGEANCTTGAGIATSTITIEFEKNDFEPVCSAISSAIIYNDIPPAAADRAVSSRQHKKRLENGSAVNQMMSSAIQEIYGKSNLAKIFDAKNDILKNTNYVAIQEAYPKLLDANRYNIIICGNTDENIFPILEKTFGQLAPLSSTKETQKANVSSANIPGHKSRKVKIVHTFLTDIPAEEAGPQPAVLIPTTEFLDPVLYITKAPESDKKEQALYNALLNYSASLMNSWGSNASVTLPRHQLPFGTLIVQDVAHTRQSDAACKKAYETILKRLQEAGANGKIVQEIKNEWTEKQMARTQSMSGTAELIQRGYELFPDKPEPDFYLQEYSLIQEASAQDFLEVIHYLNFENGFQIYSADSKS